MLVEQILNDITDEFMEYTSFDIMPPCTVLTINFNTPFLIYMLVKSLAQWKIKNLKLVIGDAGTNKLPEVHDAHMYGLEITVKHIPSNIYADIDSIPIIPKCNNYASYRHSRNIQWMLDNVVDTDVVMLVDSDVVFDKPGLADYISKMQYYDVIGSIRHPANYNPRIAPWQCLFKKTTLAKYNIRWDDPLHMMYINDNFVDDTGNTLYRAIMKNKLRFFEINEGTLNTHLKGGSYDTAKYNAFCNQYALYIADLKLQPSI